MPFLTTSRITFSCLTSVAPQADSCWLGHLVTDDVVIADIGGQALDILLHGPESAHKNGIVKTFIHTSIPIHTPCTLLKKKKKKKNEIKKKALNLPNMMPSFTGPLPVHRGDGRRSGGLALASQDCSTSEAFPPRTVLTENICRCVQQILQHFTTKMPFLTTSRITFSCLASVAPQADSWWLEHLVTDDVVIADIGGQALDILLHGPESAHKNSIVKTFIDTSIPIHTPCTLLKKKKKKKALSLPNMMPSFTGPLPVHRGDGRRSGSLALASQDCFTSVAFSPRTVLTENIGRWVQEILQHFTTKMPFLTTSRITFSCLAAVAPQVDSCWLGHLVPDDVVGGQALDILLLFPYTLHAHS